MSIGICEIAATEFHEDTLAAAMARLFQAEGLGDVVLNVFVRGEDVWITQDSRCSRALRSTDSDW
jgi:hypothetical protein